MPTTKINNMKNKSIVTAKVKMVIHSDLLDPKKREDFINAVVRDFRSDTAKYIDEALQKMADLEKADPLDQLRDLVDTLKILTSGEPVKPSNKQVAWVRNQRDKISEASGGIVGTPEEILNDAERHAAILASLKGMHDYGDPECSLGKILAGFPDN